MRALHEGRFAEIYDRWRILNPHNPPNETRLRQYLACLFAWQARGVPGDFIAAGVSFGVAPHVIYDFVGFSGLLKTYHFVDPFTGVMAGGSVNPAYNVDFELVRRQYPADAPIRFHRAMMPGCFPLEGVSAIAFAHLNVTDPPAEAASLAYLYERLAPGGAIVIDDYALNAGQFDVYDSAIERSGATIFTMVTGQGVIVKPIEST